MTNYAPLNLAKQIRGTMTIQGAPQAVVPLEWCPPNLLFIAFLLYIGVVPWVNDHMTTPSRRPCPIVIKTLFQEMVNNFF